MKLKVSSLKFIQTCQATQSGALIHIVLDVLEEILHVAMGLQMAQKASAATSPEVASVPPGTYHPVGTIKLHLNMRTRDVTRFALFEILWRE